MGKKKLEIKKIENPTNRRVTYSKRQKGLLNKAHELAVLCDIDIAVIAFSPSGNLTEFCSDGSSIEKLLTRHANYTGETEFCTDGSSIEKVLTCHANYTGEQGGSKGKSEKVPETVEYLSKVGQKLTDEQGLESPGVDYADLQLELQNLGSQLKKARIERSVSDEEGLESPGVDYADLQLELQNLRSQLKKARIERSVSEQSARLFRHSNFADSLDSLAECSEIRSSLAQAIEKVEVRIGQLEKPEVGPGVRQNTVQQTSCEMISGLPARHGSNIGSTAHSTQDVYMHDSSGVPNLNEPPPIMANAQMRGQLHDGDMDQS